MGSEAPRHWRLKEQRYNLVGEICLHCATKMFPPRDICPNCGGETKVTTGATVVYSSMPSSPTEVSTSSK